MPTDWIVGDAQPPYRLHYRYAYWGGKRFIAAAVYLNGWGLLFSARRETARAAYRAAQRAVRTYHKHGTVHYDGSARS